jgi:hypothetical protein
MNSALLMSVLPQVPSDTVLDLLPQFAVGAVEAWQLLERGNPIACALIQLQLHFEDEPASRQTMQSPTTQAVANCDDCNGRPGTIDASSCTGPSWICESCAGRRLDRIYEPHHQ